MNSARVLAAPGDLELVASRHPDNAIDLRGQLELLLASGTHPAFSANRGPALGEFVQPNPAAIAFGSTGPVPVGLRGYRAALHALEELAGTGPGSLTPARWFNELRDKIAAGIAGTRDCGIVLLPGPATARAMAREIAAWSFVSPFREIAAAQPDFTGFDMPSSEVTETLQVALRDGDGSRRPMSEIDNDIRGLVTEALCDGSPVLLHVLDSTTCGLTGPTRRVARALTTIAPTRLMVLIDASQMRCSREQIASDLAFGHMVLVTGSHFAGGPPDCAALLIPRRLCDDLVAGVPGIAAVGLSRHDISAAIRSAFVIEPGAINLGLGLRWTAALAEWEACQAVPEELRRTILETFSRKTRALAVLCRGIIPETRLIEEIVDEARDSVVPLIVEPADGEDPMDWARKVHSALRQPCEVDIGDVVCLAGPPIPFGPYAALPVSLSAATVSEVGQRVMRGIGFDTAFGPVARDLGTFFGKLDMIQGDL